MYAVTGSTGHVGGAVVRALRAQGKQVRALLRNEEKSGMVAAFGAEPYLASVEDPSHLEAAFEGVEAVFVMTPPLSKAHDPRTEHRLMLATIQHALQAAHVPKVVFLSSIGAQHEEGTGAILKLHDMEQALFTLPLAAISIRAAYFMENLLPLSSYAQGTGKLPAVVEPLDRAIPMIATEDIGRVAAQLMMEETDAPTGPETRKRIVELEGPQRYSMQDAAAILSRQFNRVVEPELVPSGARQAMYEQFGFTAGSAETMVEMANGFNNGLVAFTGGEGVEPMQGAMTLEDVLQAGNA